MPPFAVHIVRRLILTAGTFAAASILIFALIQLAPGHVERLVAEQEGGGAATFKTVQAVRRELGLDKSYPERYALWLSRSLRGDFEFSFRTGRSITQDLLERSGHTFSLIVCAAAFAGLAGAGSAFLATAYSYGPVDHALRGLAIASIAIPMFYLGAILILVFGLQLALLPIIGDVGPASWILPAVTLGTGPAAIVSLVARVLLEREMGSQYVVTARSRGAGRLELLFVEALPNTVGLIVTALLTQVGFNMLPGTIVVERVFAWDGVGSYFLQAVLFRDFPVMQAVLLLFVAVVMVLSLIADTVQFLADPRLRRGLQASVA
jgi:peptide/nickel transport system permease protein